MELSKQGEVILENKLITVVKESGLETTKAQYILDKFQDYFALASEWESKAKSIIVTNEDQKPEMEMAKVGRLFLAKKRIDIEKARKELKEQSLREGKAIDGIANFLKALIVPIEEHLKKQEKFVELRKAEKDEAEKIEAERKAEEERIAKEKAEKEEQERIRLENERLKKESVEKEIALEAERDENERALEAERAEVEAREEQIKEKAKASQEKLKRESEKKLAVERSIREKAEKKAQGERDIAKKKQEESDKKAKAEQDKIRKEAEVQAEIARKEKEKLEEMLKTQVQCPYCSKKFQLKKEV